MPLTEVLIIFSAIVCGGITVFYCLLNLLAFRTPDNPLPLKDLPFISILLAVRDEATVIRRCLDSLLAQEYPFEKLEILVGNDGSEDETAQIIAEYEDRFPHVKGVDITGTLGLARGKSNVLAQLARRAKGDIFLLTDADMWLPPSWCPAMAAAFEEGVGVVTGFTSVERATLVGKMQAVEWSLAIGMMKVAADMGKPASSMGNNMAVLARAYRATGGYESQPFSVTEDFQLARLVSGRGFLLKQLVHPAVSGLTLPERNFSKLMQQRRRWMKGAMQLPAWMILLLLFQMMYYPFLIAGLLLTPWLWVLAPLKLSLQTIFCVRTTMKAGKPLKIADCLGFEFYSAIISLSTLIYYVLPGGVRWKGRTY